MKTPRNHSLKRGFTLMELMVAMAITTIIVTVLVSITSIALDTWNRSRAELRAARQAKSMVDTMARDFEALVTRRSNLNEWLSATSPETQPGSGTLTSSNSSDLIFFSGSTDRYNGEIGTTTDKGGDVSCIGYSLDYRDPIQQAGNFDTFVLNRVLVNPDDTFKDLLGKTDLSVAFATYKDRLKESANFVCENIYQFTVTFHVEVTIPNTAANTVEVVTKPFTVGQTTGGQVVKSFRIKGTGIETPPTTADEVKAGRIKAVEISLTVISDNGIDQLRTRRFTPQQQADFLLKNSYHYTKLVQLPGM
jgi:prepilin-type N-terminal cleavage/methylation domain-containing protein